MSHLCIIKTRMIFSICLNEKTVGFFDGSIEEQQETTLLMMLSRLYGYGKPRPKVSQPDNAQQPHFVTQTSNVHHANI